MDAYDILYSLQRYVRRMYTFRTIQNLPMFVQQIKIKNMSIKNCSTPELAKREYYLMREINALNPSFFKVPKVLSHLNRNNRTYLVTEYLDGYHVGKDVTRFLWNGDDILLGHFLKIGKGLKELHELDLDIDLIDTTYLNLPCSKEELFKQMLRITRELLYYGFLNLSQTKDLIDAIKESDINYLLESVNMHGDFNLSNILVLKSGNPIFLDFATMFRGPRYIDIVTFLNRLYLSLFTLPCHFNKIRLIRNNFLIGYFDSSSEQDFLRIFEIYNILCRTTYLLRRLRLKNLGILKIIEVAMLGSIKARMRLLLKFHGIV